MIEDVPMPRKTLRDHLKFLRRRKLPLLVCASVIYALALVYAITAPPVYESTATILVEDQSVSPNYVRSAITGFASQQVQVISQRVLTVETVAALANKYHLYRGDAGRPRVPSAELERTFRRDMILELVSAETIDPRNYRKTEVTIAFTLGFKAEDPETARQVTDELVTLFLEENRRDRSSVAASTSEFLSAEAARLNDELLEIEQKLAAFKTAHDGSLPEQYEFNLDTLERVQRKLAETTLREQELRQRQVDLSSRLAMLPPIVARRSNEGEEVVSDVDRLRALQAEFRRKSAIYKESHPDVERLSREISELQERLGVGADIAGLQLQLEEQRASLAALRERYNDSYFEVRKAQRMVSELEDRLREARVQSAERLEAAAPPNNPAYLLVSSQIEAISAELESLISDRAALEERAANYEMLLRRAPDVEREYNALLRNYENANDKFQDFKAKAREAAVASNLEVEQKGERFIVVEPAVTPVKPISPNRSAIVLIGAVLGVGMGLGVALLLDAFQGAVHGSSDVARLVGAPPLAVVPYINNQREAQVQQWMTYAAIAVAGLLGVLVVLYYAGRDLLQLVSGG